jgi:hypothetical protein
MRAGPLLLVAAALAGVLALEYAVGAPEPAEAPAMTRPANLPAAAPAPADADQALLTEAVGTVLARPLFAPSRRPAATPGAQSSGATHIELPRLAGVIVTPNGRRAIFAPATGQAIAAAEGAAIGDWVVKSISAHEVTLSGSEGERVLRPSFAAANGAPAAPPELGPSAAQAPLPRPVLRIRPGSPLAQPK